MLQCSLQIRRFIYLYCAVAAESLPDHLLAHSVEESDHQQLIVDSEQSKNDFGSLKVFSILSVHTNQ